jgi:hypothetical protein
MLASPISGVAQILTTYDQAFETLTPPLLRGYDPVLAK